MDLLKLPSLIGILTDGTEMKLTPVSSDVFVSIPDRNFEIWQFMQGLTPSRSKSTTWQEKVVC